MCSACVKTWAPHGHTMHKRMRSEAEGVQKQKHALARAPVKPVVPVHMNNDQCFILSPFFSLRSSSRFTVSRHKPSTLYVALMWCSQSRICLGRIRSPPALASSSFLCPYMLSIMPNSKPPPSPPHVQCCEYQFHTHSC